MAAGPDSEVELPSARQVRDFTEQLLSWFREHGRHFPWRKKSTTGYERIVAEILLQRTQADTVASFLPSFINRYPSWRKLAEATEGELQEWFKPIGLWRRKAASLYRLANKMATRRGRFPRERSKIESLPGIGQYIASAVLLFCHGDAQPLLDASMARVLERYFGARKLVDIRYDPYLQALARKVISVDEQSAVQVNWAILDLATLVCKKKLPKCNICPIAGGCLFRKRNEGVLSNSENG
jgi:A/G-specific adenine glycosylase